MIDTAAMLSPADVAKALGVSEGTVRNRLADGTIPAKRLGRLILVPKAWVDAFTAEA